MGRRAGVGRAEKERRRRARKAKKEANSSPVDGWHTLDELDTLPDSAFEFPDKELFDVSRCPVDENCAGCGATSGLRVNSASFGGGNAACATVCPDCDGRSFVHLLSDEQLERAFFQHAQHLEAPAG